MAYFVTGATGFIGHHLVERLLKRGKPVYALVRKGSQKKLDALRQALGATDKTLIAVEGDLAQTRLGVSDATLKKLKGKIDHVFHLAAIYDLAASAEDQKVANVQGTRNAVRFAGQNQVIAINRGARDGLERGHVLALLRDSGVQPDKTDEARPELRLPGERNGLMMVFRVFERVSYALVLQIADGVKVGDRFVNP